MTNATELLTLFEVPLMEVEQEAAEIALFDAIAAAEASREWSIGEAERILLAAGRSAYRWHSRKVTVATLHPLVKVAHDLASSLALIIDDEVLGASAREIRIYANHLRVSALRLLDDGAISEEHALHSAWRAGYVLDGLQRIDAARPDAIERRVRQLMRAAELLQDRSS